MYPVLFSLGPITIYSFGLMAALALIVASFVIWKRGRENNLYEQDIFDAIFVISFVGLVGARLVFVLEHFKEFGLSYYKWFSLTEEPGLSFEGALLLGIIALWYLAGKKRWDFFQAGDIGFTGLALGQSFGWIGAFLSGFGMGAESRKFGLTFVGQDVARFPSQIVWALGFFVVFVILWREEYRFRLYDWYKGRKPTINKGYITFLYFICLGILTMIVAPFNDNSIYFLSVNRANWLGSFYIILGMVGIYIRSGREVREDRRRLWLLLNGCLSRLGRKLNKFTSNISNLRRRNR